VALTCVFLPRPLSAWRTFTKLVKENTATLMWVRGVLDVLRHHMRADDGDRTRMTSLACGMYVARAQGAHCGPRCLRGLLIRRSMGGVQAMRDDP